VSYRAENRELAGSFALGSWRVRRVGYGAMQLARDAVTVPGLDRDEALRVLRAAVDNGVNHIDTALYRGSGVVNDLIREALHPYPADLAIVSTVAARRDTDGAILPFDESDRLRRGIEENLASLGVSRLAAVNLRAPDPSTPDPGFDALLGVLIQARDEGLVDGIGLSNISRPQLLRAVEQTEIACVQNLYNLADQRCLDVLEECTRRGIAFVPCRPLGWPQGAGNWSLTSPVLAKLGARLRATPAQIALARLLDLAPNILLIPGTHTHAHLRENLGAARVELDEAARAELAWHFPAIR
jgi:pyridoxine 4-dehydrogenase